LGIESKSNPYEESALPSSYRIKKSQELQQEVNYHISRSLMIEEELEYLRYNDCAGDDEENDF
jgi:hypothetical protein